MTIMEAITGDLTRVEADALVNAANNHLWMGGGVAGALKRAGGREIEAEAVKKGPIPVGEAAVTGAGKLRARFIIHAAVMGQDLRTDARKIAAATRSALLQAEELGIKSLAFPALGTGVGGFPMAECARVMVAEVASRLAAGSRLERVTFVLLAEEARSLFAREIERARG